MLTLAMMFKDGMVLQRGREVSVWGTAEPGDSVTVTVQGQMVQASADADGGWMAKLPALHASGSEEMTVTSGSSQITLTDVAVGEVWMAGGQSNMEFYMRFDKEIEAEKKVCADPLLRFFDYPEVSYVGQLDDADYSEHYGFWRKADADDLQWWSAVPYYFAKDLRAKLGVPVGILACNWGGTTSSCWMPESLIREVGGQRFLDDYQAELAQQDLSHYDEQFANNPMNFRTDQLTGFGHEVSDFLMSGDYTADTMMAGMAQVMRPMLEAQGIDPDRMDISQFVMLRGPKHEWRPAGLYESMLLQVVPYTIRGFIYYQGESDGNNGYGDLYHKMLAALIGEWRRLWGDENLPFLFVELPGMDRWMQNLGRDYIAIRHAQHWVASHVKNTAMAVITDNGMEWDIHPVIKRPVGHRLALLAENKVYGDSDVFCEAPTLENIAVEEGKLILTFDHAGEGLHLTDHTIYGEEIPANTFPALEIFQDGRKLDAADFTVTTEGAHVFVTSDAIRAGVPTEVKIGEQENGWFIVNLYNAADIPADVADV